MTATANIAASTAQTAGADAASRAALKNMPAGMNQMFEHLLGKEQSAQEAQPTATTQTDAKMKTVDDATAPQNIDQALLAQLKELMGKDAQGDTSDGDAQPKLPRAKAKTTDPQAAVVPTGAIANMLTKVAMTQGGKIGDAAKKILPVTQRGAAEAAAKTDDGETKAGGVGEQLKTLASAKDDAKHQAAPAQTTIAKALGLHLGGTDANGGQGSQAGNGEHQQQRGQSQQTAQNDATLKPADAAQPAAAAPAPAPSPAHPQTTQQAQPSADALAANNAAPQATAQTAAAHPVTAAIHVAQQTDATAVPNFGSLAVSVAAKSKNGEKHFDIRLDPAELGRVDVKLTIDDAGKAQANLSAEKPHTLELLQRDRATLERALRDAGLDLAGGGLNFSLKGQDRNGGDASTPFAKSRALAASAIASANTGTPIAGLSHITPVDSRLDIRV